MKKIFILLVMLVIMLSLSLVSLSVGTVFVPFQELWINIFDENAPFSFIVLEYRFPRVIISILAGSGLAIAGVILQSVVRNPLASPDVIGITKGAGFFAALIIYVFPSLPIFVLPVAAFLGAFIVFILLFILSNRFTLNPVAFALTGIALGAIFQSGIQYLLVKNPTDINSALLWMSGSLWGRNWDDVYTLLPWIVILIPIVWLNFQKLNIIQLGDEYSQTLGLDLIKQRFWLILLAVLLTGISVSAVGSIGFIGLIAPHIARKLVGGRHNWMIPLAAIIGVNLMLIGDCLGRFIIIPREVPVGIMTAIIGAPYFIYLLRKERLKK